MGIPDLSFCFVSFIIISISEYSLIRKYKIMLSFPALPSETLSPGEFADPKRLSMGECFV